MNKTDTVYFEPNYVQRLRAMVQGLRMPSGSREYKAAKIELQRLTAPLTAVAFPLVLVALLVVLSDGSSATEFSTPVSVLDDISLDVDWDEPEPPEPPPNMDMTLDFQVDSTVAVVEIGRAHV